MWFAFCFILPVLVIKVLGFNDYMPLGDKVLLMVEVGSWNGEALTHKQRKIQGPLYVLVSPEKCIAFYTGLGFKFIVPIFFFFVWEWLSQEVNIKKWSVVGNTSELLSRSKAKFRTSSSTLYKTLPENTLLRMNPQLKMTTHSFPTSSASVMNKG